MEGRLSTGPSRPKTVAELVAQGENFAFNTNIPLKHWMRAAETLYQEANFALADGDYGRAYMMFYRHSVLVLNYLPKHPHYKDPEIRQAGRLLSRRVGVVLKEMEQLKPVLDGAVVEWDRMRPPSGRELSKVPKQPSTYDEFAARDPSLGGNARILDASENQDLAVDLAQKELMRRDAVKRASHHAEARHEDIYIGKDASGPDSDLRIQMEAARRNLESPGKRHDLDHPLVPRSHPSFGAHARPFTPQNYTYPSVAKSQPVTLGQRSHDPEASSSRNAVPSLPPKEPTCSASSGGLPPQIPRKVVLDDYKPLVPGPSPNTLYSAAPVLPPKTVEETPSPPKKQRLAFKPGAYLENGDPIRSIFIPTGLRASFLELAEANTRAGIEMCGILCGTPINNALFVRCLLIPDQHCTPDTCETENESSMFDYCDQEDLLVIGWIHTHPTQTCFMSSRDLHTQAGYQVMMPESVAIVCSPRFTPSYGIFRLTNPPGLEHILHCGHTDTFHQHSIGNLYREAEQPHGHVYETDKMPFYVHDLRRKT